MSERVYESINSGLKKVGIPKDPNIISTWQKYFLINSELDLATKELQLLSAWRHGVFLANPTEEQSPEKSDILSPVSNASSIPLIDFRESKATEFFEAVVIYPFKSGVHDELVLELGSIIVVTRVEGREPEWWYGSCSSSMGWFPASYVVRR